MKFKHLYTVLLVLLVIFGLVLSYFILYDIPGFSQIIEGDNSVTDDSDMNMSEIPSVVQENNTYTTTKLRTQHVISPVKVYFRELGDSFKIQSESIRNTVTSLIESRPIKLKNKEIENNSGTINYLYNIDHLQLVLPERLPLGLYNHLLDISSEVPTDILIDRIIIPLIEEENETAYLVDSATDNFLVGQLSENLKHNDLRNVITRDDAQLEEMGRYFGAEGPIYLPIENLTLPSLLYTIRTIPESIFVSKVFHNNDYNVSELSSSDDGIFRYQNYLNTLDINRGVQRFTLSVNRVDQGESRTIVEKIRNAMNLVRDFEYWQEDIYIDSFTNNNIQYRHYINGYPIHSKANTVDYGSSSVQLRNDLSGDVYRYQQSMLTLQLFIDNMSEEYLLANYEEILEILASYNYSITDFEDIFIGYLWSENMEMFKKCELIPTWFFAFEGKIYTIDDIQEDEFAKIWERHQGGAD